MLGFVTNIFQGFSNFLSHATGFPTLQAFYANRQIQVPRLANANLITDNFKTLKLSESKPVSVESKPEESESAKSESLKSEHMGLKPLSDLPIDVLLENFINLTIQRLNAKTIILRLHLSSGLINSIALTKKYLGKLEKVTSTLQNARKILLNRENISAEQVLQNQKIFNLILAGIVYDLNKILLNEKVDMGLTAKYLSNPAHCRISNQYNENYNELIQVFYNFITNPQMQEIFSEVLTKDCFDSGLMRSLIEPGKPTIEHKPEDIELDINPTIKQLIISALSTLGPVSDIKNLERYDRVKIMRLFKLINDIHTSLGESYPITGENIINVCTLFTNLHKVGGVKQHVKTLNQLYNTKVQQMELDKEIENVSFVVATADSEIRNTLASAPIAQVTLAAPAP